MQTGAMTMKSRMTVTEALKERELLKKRITKKIGQLGREAGTDGAFAERRSARFDADRQKAGTVSCVWQHRAWCGI